MKRKAPYIFLSILLLVVIFLIGVRYGQQVELVNKNIKLLISLPPSPPLKPTTPPLQFTQYSHKGCFLSFLLPNLLEKTQEGSFSAVFAEEKSGKKQLAISLSCSKNNEITPAFPLPSPIRIQSTTLYPKTVNNMFVLEFKHPLKQLYLSLSIKKDLFPLLQKSLSFE